MLVVQDTYSVVRSVELLHYWLSLRLQHEDVLGATPFDGQHTAAHVTANASTISDATHAPDRAGYTALPSVVTWFSESRPDSPDYVGARRCGDERWSTAQDVPSGVLDGRFGNRTHGVNGVQTMGQEDKKPTAMQGGVDKERARDGEFGNEEKADDDVVIIAPSDTCSPSHSHGTGSESRNEVLDEVVGLGWWWRPRKDAAACEQTGDVSVLDKVFGESWASRSERRRKLSIYGAHEGWRLQPLIVKAGDDLRQEQFAMQLIGCIHSMWQDAGLPLRVQTYSILALSPSTGVMEMVPDTVSLAALRKRHQPFVSLHGFYAAAFGDGSNGKLQAAQTNFVRSMAAYSLICYILKVKDRHDGNILLQRDGSIMHIDWGYMLGRSMNAVLEVERAPFKLTRDHVAVMGGEMSANFISYISLCVQGLQVLRERGAELVELVRAMNVGSPLTCVNDTEIAELQERLALKYSEKEVVERFILLQGQALRSWSTGAYDLLQTFIGV
jgi:hypothetical protein